MGLGFLGCLGFGRAAGRPLMLISGSGLASGLGLSVGFLSGVELRPGLGGFGVGRLGFLAENVRGGGRGDFAGGDDLALVGRRRLFGRFGLGRLSWRARFCWAAARSGRARWARARACRSGPRPERSTSSCSLLLLLLQFARAAFEALPLRRRPRRRRAARAAPDAAQPLAQLEIGQEEQADEIEHQEDDRRARRAEVVAADAGSGSGRECRRRRALRFRCSFAKWSL